MCITYNNIMVMYNPYVCFSFYSPHTHTHMTWIEINGKWSNHKILVVRNILLQIWWPKTITEGLSYDVLRKFDGIKYSIVYAVCITVPVVLWSDIILKTNIWWSLNDLWYTVVCRFGYYIRKIHFQCFRTFKKLNLLPLRSVVCEYLKMCL